MAVVAVIAGADSAAAAVLNARAAASVAEDAGPRSTSQAAHAFRLGTGAGPFGWSTAIADFNRDGAPDIAVVDSVGRTSRGFEYSLELMVSSVAAYAVRFETAHQAVRVAVRDVDRDRHPDLVIMSPLGHEVLGIWLNDGQGRFERTATVQTSERGPPSGRFVSPRATAASGAPIRAPGWRDDAPCRASSVIVATPTAHGRAASYGASARAVPHASSIASRAPPPVFG